MAEKKTISVRFCMENQDDEALYECVEQEAGGGSSLASIVKTRLKRSYEYETEVNKKQEFQNEMIMAVRDEMQNSGMRLIGVLLSSINSGVGDSSAEPERKKEKLPEKGETLPENLFEFLR